MTQEWGEVLKNFMADFGDTKSSFPITNRSLINAINNVNNYKNLLMSLDIEFQTVINDKNHLIVDQTKTIKGHSISSFPRELGIMIFQFKDKQWIYLGKVFINFGEIYNYKDGKVKFDVMDTKFMQSKYCTVTDEILQKLKENEKVFMLDNLLEGFETMNDAELKAKVNEVAEMVLVKTFIDPKLLAKFKELPNSQNKQSNIVFFKKKFSRASFEMFGRYMPKEYVKNFTNQLELYWNDPLVKKRVIEKKEFWFLEAFAKLSHMSLFLIKGERDLMAIKNLYRLFLGSDKFINLEHKYDIEVFNGMSHAVFKSSQLESTYHGLKKLKHYRDHDKEFFSKLKNEAGEKAHNPLVDAYYTFVIAVIMNMVFVDCVNKQSWQSRISYLTSL